MFARILITALVAGLLAGVFAFGAQRLGAVPLIERAEIFEAAAEAKKPHDHGAGDVAHLHDAGAEEWEPENWERTVYTLLFDVLSGIAFALILGGAIAMAHAKGYAIDLRRGLLWGAAGFAVFALAPSLGLPPEPPGAAAADLGHRQIWWAATAFATAVGLALIVFRSEIVLRLAGAMLLVAPHLVGAPHPAEHGGSAPPELVRQFIVASILTAAFFWLVLGGVTGWLYRRLG